MLPDITCIEQTLDRAATWFFPAIDVGGHPGFVTAQTTLTVWLRDPHHAKIGAMAAAVGGDDQDNGHATPSTEGLLLGDNTPVVREHFFISKKKISFIIQPRYKKNNNNNNKKV